MGRKLASRGNHRKASDLPTDKTQCNKNRNSALLTKQRKAAAQATEEEKTKGSKKQSFPKVSSDPLNRGGKTVPTRAGSRDLLGNPSLYSRIAPCTASPVLELGAGWGAHDLGGPLAKVWKALAKSYVRNGTFKSGRQIRTSLSKGF